MINDPKHPLYGVSIKIQRAQDQLKVLSEELTAFLNGKPYEIESQIDPKAEHLLGVVRIRKTCAPMWSAMIGDIVHNFRCALDYLVFQLVFLSIKAESTSNQLQFPICDTASEFMSRCFDKTGKPIKLLEGVGADAITLIKSVQPFATGEGKTSPLSHLRNLSNWDKHHSIYLTGASAATSFVQGQIELGEGYLLFQQGPFEDDTPLFGREVPPGPESFADRAAKMKIEGGAKFYIVFKKPDTEMGLGIEGALRDIDRRVCQIAERINTEIFKL